MEQQGTSPESLGVQGTSLLVPAHLLAKEEVPARVRAAMEFLHRLSWKTQPFGVVNNLTIEVVPGQKLTDEEIGAQATAHNLLSKYFAGTLSPSLWEQEVLQKNKEGGGSGLPQRRGIHVRCISCLPTNGKPGCPYCNGHGEILVFPVAKE